MFENLLTTMESILSQSAVLLRSASALSRSLSRGKAPTEILRLEIDNTLLETDTEYSRQDLDAFLEPCGVVTPLGSSHTSAMQAQGGSDSLFLGPSLSPLRSMHIPASRQIRLRDRTSLGTPTSSFSGLVSPAKRGVSTVYSHLSSPSCSPLRSDQISTSQQVRQRNPMSLGTPTASLPGLVSPANHGVSPVCSNLSSPAKLPTPAFFNDAWFATDLRTPSIVSPV